LKKFGDILIDKLKIDPREQSNFHFMKLLLIRKRPEKKMIQLLFEKFDPPSKIADKKPIIIKKLLAQSLRD
jgi:hypothetical protein